MKTSNIKIILSLITITLLLSSCTWFQKRQAPRGKNIICLVDFSDSKNSTTRLQFYSHIINDNIINNLGVNDKISVIPIDKASITNASDIILIDLSSIEFEPEIVSPIEEDQIIKNNLKKFKDSLKIDFEKKFNDITAERIKSNHETDIFGALEVVKGKLKPNDDNFIIILSDMMNWSKTLIMEPSNRGFNSKSINKILEKIPNIDMPSTTVLVLTGEQVEVSPEHYKLVQTFWTKYFAKNQIILFDYNSASVSKLNDLMMLPLSEK